MKTRFIISVLALVILTGCVSGPVAAAKKAGIKKVSVEPRVNARQGMRYGVDMSGGGLANSLASMIVDSAGQKGIQRMSGVMATNHIEVPQIVHDRTVEKLRQCDAFELTESESDGVFLCTIYQYGFDNSGLQTSKKYPVIMLSIELRDRKGKKVWFHQNSVFQLTTEGIGGTWEQYEADPEKLRADWVKQIDNILGRLVKCK